jgi:hypothetical protein
MREINRFKLIRAGELNHRYDDAPQEVREAIDKEYDDMVARMKTVDRRPIVDGLRVFTNNLDRGTVDLSRLDFEYNHSEKRWVPWFDVNLDTNYKGRPTTGKELQSDDRVTTRFEGKNA